MENPAFGNGELTGHLKLALRDWLGESVRRLDLDESLGAIRHFNQEVGHDVADAGVGLFPRPRGRCGFEQLDLQRIALLAPLVPDGQRLLLNVCHNWTGNQDGGRHPFKLPLTTDRSVLLRARHQEKRTWCSATKPESRRRTGLIRTSHVGSLWFLGLCVYGHAALFRCLVRPFEAEDLERLAERPLAAPRLLPIDDKRGP